ncbi:MAG: hypothetical protein LBG11_00580, partial [Bifidobacteriaceae bacterium]|nr:hypothetical protein [Bifidobacteriaceae bacterium]
TGASAGGTSTFTGLDLTAWVEINLAELGWVAFFPTPSRQDSPEQADERPDPEPNPRQAQPPPVEPEQSPPPDEDLVPVPVGSAKPLANPPTAASWGLWQIAGLSGAGLIGLLAVTGAGLAAARAWRRRRRSRRGTPAERIAAGWSQVLDCLRCRKLLARQTASATRLETARAGPLAAVELLTWLAAEADAATFAAAAPTAARAARYWETVALAERQLVASRRRSGSIGAVGFNSGLRG